MFADVADLSWLHSGGPDDYPYARNWFYNEGAYHNNGWFEYWSGEKSVSGNVRLVAVLRPNTNNAGLQSIRIRGKGHCPFTSGDETAW